MQDLVSDALTRIRNAQMVRKKTVSVRATHLIASVIQVLCTDGFLESFQVVESQRGRFLEVVLKYDNRGKPVIRYLKRVSRPGLRVYSTCDLLPEVKGGLGIAVMSTSKGVFSTERARQLRVGGEVICIVW